MNRQYIAAPALAGALLLIGSPAGATRIYQHITTAESTDTYGNSDVYASYDYYAFEMAELDMWEPPATPSNQTLRFSKSAVSFSTSAGLFGLSAIPLQADAFGYASQQKIGSAASTYTQPVLGSVKFMGSSQYYVYGTGVACPNSSHSNCASFDKVYSSTFFSASGTFTLGFIPVTVTGSASGSVHAGLNASSYSAPYLGIADKFYGTTAASLNAHGILSASFSAEAGLPGIIGLGVTANIGLVDAAVTPGTSDTYVTNGNPGAKVVYSNSMPLRVTMMNGSVEVFGEILSGKVSKTIVSWSGIPIAQTNFYNVSGSLNYSI